MVTLTLATLLQLGACNGGVTLFRHNAPSGSMEYSAETDLRLRAMAPDYRNWLRTKGVIPSYLYGSGSGSGSGYGDGSGDGDGDG